MQLHSQKAKTPIMKKGILFASGIALTLGFASCDDGSAKVAEIQAQLDAANQQKQVTLDSLALANQANVDLLTTTYQVQVDSLQWIIDSLTAPKGTKPTKPKPTSKPTTTEAPKTDEGGKLDVKGSDGGKLDVKGTTSDTTGGKKGGKLNVKP